MIDDNKDKEEVFKFCCPVHGFISVPYDGCVSCQLSLERHRQREAARRIWEAEQESIRKRIANK